MPVGADLRNAAIVWIVSILTVGIFFNVDPGQRWDGHDCALYGGPPKSNRERSVPTMSIFHQQGNADVLVQEHTAGEQTAGHFKAKIEIGCRITILKAERNDLTGQQNTIVVDAAVSIRIEFSCDNQIAPCSTANQGASFIHLDFDCNCLFTARIRRHRAVRQADNRTLGAKPTVKKINWCRTQTKQIAVLVIALPPRGGISDSRKYFSYSQKVCICALHP